MIGTLTKEQSEHVLRSGLIGRIGCSDKGGVYIVPVTYVYDDKCIYAHSREGLKVEMMRKNPQVCFEVDSIESMTNWRCVVIQGTFQELKADAEQTKAVAILKDRLMPYLLSETMRPKGFDHGPTGVEKERKPVVYRIRIDHMTGRFEKNYFIGNLPS
jgi:nitroimidazol reductase NimA-like FMN-containing flavoprotein (pyridoxamine 5'-phosphate oxidase superfamily)